jgi:hypothetical protein
LLGNLIQRLAARGVSRANAREEPCAAGGGAAAKPTWKDASRWREAAPALVITAVAVGARLAWLASTNFIFEDAFITFQFGKRLAAGQGFVYNPGEPIYGTTTPLLTLFLAGWLKVFPGAVVSGARLIGLLASICGLALTWAVLGRVGVTPRGRACSLALLAVSDKLWLFDAGGMETPLLFFFMMAGLYALVRGWPGRAGVAAGLLLWTRVDLVAWPVALVLGSFWTKKRPPWRFIAGTVLTYLPWLGFAILRFGSATPHTITAKWAHYRMGIAASVARSAEILLSWMSPFGAHEVAPALRVGLACGTLLLAGWGAFETFATSGLKALRILWIFLLLEAVRIVLTGATFENRYFVPMLSMTLVLAGLGLDRAVITSFRGPTSRVAYGAAAAIACAGAVLAGAHSARRYRSIQLYRNERSLMAVGRWLNANTPRGASVLLEPLGYAGYFADRRMIDEVGLVSPQVVQLTRQEFSGDSPKFSRVLLSKIQPDYFVTHCDDALREFDGSAPEAVALKAYSRRAVFNPLNFDPLHPSDMGTPRRSCYEIWEKNRSGVKDLRR